MRGRPVERDHLKHCTTLRPRQRLTGLMITSIVLPVEIVKINLNHMDVIFVHTMILTSVPNAEATKVTSSATFIAKDISVSRESLLRSLNHLMHTSERPWITVISLVLQVASLRWWQGRWQRGLLQRRQGDLNHSYSPIYVTDGTNSVFWASNWVFRWHATPMKSMREWWCDSSIPVWIIHPRPPSTYALSWLVPVDSVKKVNWHRTVYCWTTSRYSDEKIIADADIKNANFKKPPNQNAY